MPAKKAALELVDRPKKPGRPRIEINWQQFEKILELMPTQAEVASFFGISEDTLATRIKEHYQQNYSECLKRFGDKTKLSLRRNLLSMSEKNASVAIFLAKNLLGYRDQPMDIEAQIDGLKIIEE